MMDWQTRKLQHTDIDVGPCAWRLPMLAGEDRDYVLAHPSLIVVDPTDRDELLQQVGPASADLPIMLGIQEPAFARHLRDLITRRMELLGRDTLDALVLHVDDPAEIKSGGMLQTMFDLRDQGIVASLGLAHPDANVAEWLSMNAAVRLVGVAYGLADQSADHRAIKSIASYGMSAFALDGPQDDPAIRFALARTDRILPVLDRPVPAGLTPMTSEQASQAWEAYAAEHPCPPPLPRGRPPMADV